MKTISVIGLGKLGLCIASVLAKYYIVIAIDKNKQHIIDLNKGINSIHEKDLDKWYNKYKDNMVFTFNYTDLGDITFVVVPTPSMENNKFSSMYIEDALSKIKKPQVVVIVSTVMPTEIQRLQKKYKRLTLIYSPTFIALGTVIKNFIEPDFILIGTETGKGGEKLKNIYRKICKNPKFVVLYFIEAEIAKLAINCYITMKITFANQIGNLCHRLNIVSDDILKTIGTDKRIGESYLRAGLGYGGPCFPRDNLALSEFMMEHEANAELFQVVHLLNKKQINEYVLRIDKIRPNCVGFESLSYKEGTDNKECSQLNEIYRLCWNLGYNVKIGKGNVNLNWWGIKI